VNPQKAALVEKTMHRHGQRVPHARDCAKRIGPRPQVRNFTQVLKRVPLGGNGIGVRIIHPADDVDLRRLHLDALSLALRSGERAFHDDAASSRQPQHIAGVVGQRAGRHDLNRIKARTVMHVHKT
jgi:hypothetical protein